MQWSVGEYICHIADHERIWAERFAGAGSDPSVTPVAPFDQDRLAAARNYSRIPYASAMWSLHRSYQECNATSDDALRNSAIFGHPERGELTAVDAIRNVVHECHHHLWDINRIIDATRTKTSLPKQS
ncbi:DinB family protein [Mycobacterium liflandii]